MMNKRNLALQKKSHIGFIGNTVEEEEQEKAHKQEGKRKTRRGRLTWDGDNNMWGHKGYYERTRNTCQHFKTICSMKQVEKCEVWHMGI